MLTDVQLRHLTPREKPYKLSNTGANLMKPREMPHWVSDPRIFEAILDGPVLPEDVHVWTFQDAGDGWRLAGITDMREMAGKGHYVGD